MIIDTDKIETLIKDAKEPSEKEFSLILKKGELSKGISIEEAAMLLSIKDPLKLEKLLSAANTVKQKIFGKRIVFFAPLYLTNYCKNSCLYCGFRSDNKTQPRKALDKEEIIREALTLEGMGFKRVLLVLGEDPSYGLDYIIQAIRAIYKNTGMRIIHVNAPPMDIEELKELKKEGIGVYQVFQETYHRPTYALMHPTGRKKDYDWRIGVMERAIKAGIEDTGIGALLGIYDFRFDCLSTIAHSNYLYENYAAHAHTISIPRLKEPEGAGFKIGKYGVTDEELKKITAVYRISIPSAGVVASTREPEGLRSQLINAGVSQVSAASRTTPGGYSASQKTLKQFPTFDSRTLVEVMRSVIEQGGLPSLCATCYRTGRTGETFTKITKEGDMEKFCQANAILTLKEFLITNPQNGMTEFFEDALKNAINDIKEENIKKEVEKKLKQLEQGKRDLYL